MLNVTYELSTQKVEKLVLLERKCYLQGGCPDVEMMLRMKKVILLFALTMKSYGYGIAPLYSLLQNFRWVSVCSFPLNMWFSVISLYFSFHDYNLWRDQYNEILMSEYCAQFERDLDKDNYAPIVVENDEQFRAIIKEFPFYKRSMEQVFFLFRIVLHNHVLEIE